MARPLKTLDDSVTGEAIRNVSDTARWVACYRAQESSRADALFNDPFAEALAGARGQAILRTLPKADQAAWNLIVRTAVMDEIILQSVHDRDVTTVFNLAAGLDTRPYRMALPRDLKWIEVDLPEILDYKAQVLAKAGAKARCEVEVVSQDLRDSEARQALFKRINDVGGKVLVITEGLLAYLKPDEVQGLAEDLYAQPCFDEWLFDFMSAEILIRLRKFWGKSELFKNAPFQFAPVDGLKLFEKVGWIEAEFRSSLGEAHRLGRELKYMWLLRPLFRLMPKERKQAIFRSSGIVRLTR